MEKNFPGFAWRVEVWHLGGNLTLKGHEKTFWDDGNVQNPYSCVGVHEHIHL